MKYKVTVAVGTSKYSGTRNCVYVTLVGKKGKSERTILDNFGLDLCRGATDEYIVCSDASLGQLLLVSLEKQSHWVEDSFFCRYVTVKTPDGSGVFAFPCYRWLTGDVVLELREGTAKKLSDDSLPLLLAHRARELQERQKIYRWKSFAPDMPKCIDVETEKDLPADVRFDDEKRSDFKSSLYIALGELALKELSIKFGESWDDLDDFKRTYWKIRSPVSEYAMNHWTEDWFFGYQFLNGPNPRFIRRCSEVPANFPVTADMVQSTLGEHTSLDQEIKAGNIYQVDYAILDGIPPNVIEGVKQYLAAPLCLLYDHPERGFIPLAIQLGQTSGVDTPIFLPSDPPLAWLLAKIWVRHAEFQVFQVLSHLLRTHLLIEVFCIATHRQVPAVHPIYKLLSPHLRYTLEINARGRIQLMSSDGVMAKVASTGGEGLMILAQREYKFLTYRSLQPKLDFHDRGVTKLKGYHYMEDSMMMWDAIHRFVSGVVSLYYASDAEVLHDSELQAWVQDITQEGYEHIPKFGLSSELTSREELITLLSVVIFTASAQHAATNNGQFDWCAWVPNTPCTMRCPPPIDKDAVTMEMIMNSLPDMSQTCFEMAFAWHLSRPQPDAIPIGQYVEEHFTEPQAQELIKSFQQELHDIEKKIMKKNEGLELQYLYLCPSRIENSITI
ncbi:arachidonate 12-lipoxygenase, 12S-type isoform X2 [Anguilla anguilla]|nr:arachidonate 12-lipoxygenase, 12S-type isoform X2 [Anguilla anguilla]XP_035265628.1 arachidonate 12-lipoxygenase, 12S-type isoform X2 [Anguilla anguilla]XP_035265630.1 arachidonate 12-lipoxygenase, 12S-type isoform X2 [Anguilla anguilla]